MRTTLTALKAAIFMTGAVLFWGWIALSVRAFDRGLGIVLPAWTAVPGIILMLAGATLALTCVGTFVVRGQGTPAPFDAPKEFVAVGPYKYVRNPMYIGALMVLIGFGLYERSISMLAFSLPWLVLTHLFVIYYEERILKRKFGATYERYLKAVPRWIPGA